MKQEIEAFLDYLAEDRNYSLNTIKGYAGDLEKFRAFMLREFVDKEIAPSQVDRFLISDFLHLRQKNGHRASSAYRNRRLAALKSFFGYLQKEQKLERDPTAALEWAKVTNREPDFLTYQDFQKITRHIEKTASEFYQRRDMAIVTTLYHTGLRLSELVSLNVDQVDFENELFRNVKRKGGNRKNLVVNTEVLRAVARWLRQRESLDQSDEPALFLSDRRRRLTARSIQALIAKYAQECGFQKRITPHTFRHSHCTEIQLRGASMKTAKELLDHAHIATTERYSHSNEEAKRNAVNSLVQEDEGEELT